MPADTSFSTTTSPRVWLNWLVFAAILLALPVIMPNSYWLRIYALTGIYVMLALGLNVVAGFAGLLDLAYVAFFGIGAYTFALLSSSQFNLHLPFWLALPIAAVVTMACGFVLGSTSIRLKGDYLAIVTLAFAQIFKLLLLNLDQPINITGGVNGIYNFDVIAFGPWQLFSPQAYAYLIWGAACLIIIGSFRIKRSRYGRGWEAIREDELAAAAMGVNTVWMKLMAFAGGAFVAGGAGAIFASFQDSVFPNNFDFPQLVVVYCMVILGGLGNIVGVIGGAVLLTVLPELLREYGAWRMMTYGLILVLLMALRPRGLFSHIPFLTRRRARPDKAVGNRLQASTDLYYADAQPERTLTPATADGQAGRELLFLQNVSRHFGGIAAVTDLNFKLYQGEILSIIGPNGAGKTTLFNLISGIYAPSSGAIIFNGRDISRDRPHQVNRAGIARTFQNLRVFPDMSIIENVAVGRFGRTQAGPLSILLRLPRHRREESDTLQRARRILSLFGARLTGYRHHQRASALSYANRRRLEIARALATDPKILLLDEPSAGMNPQETIEITRFIRQLRDRFGLTILLIEHKLNLVREISDRVIVMDYGRRIAGGSYAEVACNPRVIDAYLGKQRG